MTFFNIQEPTVPAISTCTDVVGCNEQVFVPQISHLELPYTYNPAERYPLNMTFTHKAALFCCHIPICAAAIPQLLPFKRLSKDADFPLLHVSDNRE